MGILVNQSQIGGGSSNSSRNIGDIFYTTRTDNSLNGAVECNGSQYNFSDFDSNLQNLLDEGKLPYLPINEFDSMVSEKGWCDKIGYKTPKMVKIYPAGNASEQPFIYIELTDEQYSSFYDTMNNCKENEILPYRLYDINTTKLLNGYYLKCTDATIGVFVVFNNEDEETSFFFIDHGSYYVTTDGSKTIPDPDKSQTDPTTYFKVPKLSAYIIQKENIPVIGNGMTLGLTNGTITGGLVYSSARELAAGVTGYGTNVGTTSIAASNFTDGTTIGITTDPEKSGMIADLSNDSFTGRVMIQLFNSTTDTAVATCNQVLADVSLLNQGDYVIETQLPTEENNYSWYRLYKSGWVEQGGEITAASVADGTGSSGNNSIILPVIMANDRYHINLQTQVGSSGWDYANGVILNSRSTTKLTVKVVAGTGSTSLFWQVSGMSAQRQPNLFK